MKNLPYIIKMLSDNIETERFNDLEKYALSNLKQRLILNAITNVEKELLVGFLCDLMEEDEKTGELTQESKKIDDCIDTVHRL